MEPYSSISCTHPETTCKRANKHTHLLLFTWAQPVKQLHACAHTLTRSHHSLGDRDNTLLFYQSIPIIPRSVSVASSVGVMYHSSSMLTGHPSVCCDGRGFGGQADSWADAPDSDLFSCERGDCGPMNQCRGLAVETSGRNALSIDTYSRQGAAPGSL